MKFQPIYALTLSLAVVACQPQSKKDQSEAHLGDLQYEFNISEQAKPHFDEGLLLLHSFEYEDARTAFQKATEADPNELMGWWGEAMSHYRALWGLQDVPAGREVMQKVAATKEERLAKAGDDLERDFWEGVEILYGEGEVYERNQAYADHMAELYEKYEGNQEVAAFYSLGLMWSIPVGRDEEKLKRSSTVAAGILDENPSHPGALHYMIHANDDPHFATQAVQAADNYAEIAPDATHALHMPSHIYLQLGRWNDVVASNETSYGASVRRMERMGLDDRARGYHSYSWLHYGYLQQGKYEKAKDMLVDMMAFTASAKTGSAEYYLVTMQAAQLVETGVWDLEQDPVTYENDMSLGMTGAQAFFLAMMAYQNQDADEIKSQIKALGTKLAAAELLVTDEGIAMCSAGPTRTAPNKNSLIMTDVRLHQMEALIALLDGDDATIEANMKKATTLQSELPFPSGPVDISYPAYEQYGDWLLENERYEEALAQYDASLARAPKRTKALMGKMEALNALGHDDEAAAVQEVLDVFWQNTALAMN